MDRSALGVFFFSGVAGSLAAEDAMVEREEEERGRWSLL